MNSITTAETPAIPVDTGLRALCGIAAFYRIAVDPGHIRRQLALPNRPANFGDLVRASKLIGLKARVVNRPKADQLAALSPPAIVQRIQGDFAVFGGQTPNGLYRLIDPTTRREDFVTADELPSQLSADVLLVARRFAGEGVNPRTIGLQWLLPSIWRYRVPLAQVLLASLFVQLFALVTPLFFQVVVDKVLAHKGYATLYVLVIGLIIVGAFDGLLQYQRSYALSHTTNRIDVELGVRLFRHLVRLPLGYFEVRAAGQTVARVREIETIRSFLTGQALFSVIDLLFTCVFIAVLLTYSVALTLIVLAAIPVYIALAVLVRPPLRERLKDKFNLGAINQQFLVETVVGIQTLKASAIEPQATAEWEERLAAYVKSSFGATMLATLGQNGFQVVNKITSAALLLFGAKAVINGDMTVGGLVAFNMIAGQTTAPILRLAQLWQDFQQVQISIERIGDILSAPAEPAFASRTTLPVPRGEIAIKGVNFRYRPNSPDVLKNVDLSVRAGEVIGIVGPSGSGKSSLTKLMQRLYVPQEGQITLDGSDLNQLDPAWLRANIGVVLQDSLLFNRTIHENIALAAPGLARSAVIAAAKLSGADEFIGKLPDGYETMIEERGANLSGGQRQRIAIARALVTNPRILIFDEATSALDYESERVIQTNMRQIVQNRTVIIIAHRLAAVRPCHRIVGMEDGRIVEIGTHTELLERPEGLYRRLWTLQNEEVGQ